MKIDAFSRAKLFEFWQTKNNFNATHFARSRQNVMFHGSRYRPRNKLEKNANEIIRCFVFVCCDNKLTYNAKMLRRRKINLSQKYVKAADVSRESLRVTP